MAVFTTLFLSLSSLLLVPVNAQCPDYTTYSQQWHPPGSGGVYNLSYMRPDPSCRTFNSSIVEDTITQLTGIIQDPDLKRLFENSYPNTLDTAIKWRGYAANDSTEELAFIITGDINAMWLRDSANQMQSYLPLLNASSDPNSLASLYRGVINTQARYILTNPFCNSYQAPVESGIPPQNNTNSDTDTVHPPFNNQTVFECKYELDSLAAFLEISANYYSATGDGAFFGKYQWVDAVEAVLNVANSMLTTVTYTPNGSVAVQPYTWERQTNRASETTENSGIGNPVQNGTGLIRSFFRPSDDATIFQYLIPANMMFSTKLAACVPIMSQISGQQCQSLASEMQSLSDSLRSAITANGIINHPKFGQIYAYEVDGYGGQNIMDDANIPSLLSAPFIGYLPQNDSLYQNTRSVLLSANNPYFMRGPVINAIGGAHDGPGYGWPMASIVRILTSDDDAEITTALQEIVSSTDQLGLIHESINTHNVTDWTRQWFSWANGLFGQMILDLSDRKPEILAQSFQGSSSS